MLSSMKMRFLPREEKFFVLFQSQIKIIGEASRLLLDGIQAGGSFPKEIAKKILELEQKGDELIHEVVQRLNQTFITPLDPEDIHRLASTLDDVIDSIEESAHRLVAYRLEQMPPPVVALGEMIHASCVSLINAFEGLENNQIQLQKNIIEINRIENDADRLTRTVVAELFQNETDAIRIMKLKEIYEDLEAVTDRCEDVADVLQNVAVKNS
jgi:uncharacterized protein